jgi:hypothetical protein
MRRTVRLYAASDPGTSLPTADHKTQGPQQLRVFVPLPPDAGWAVHCRSSLVWRADENGSLHTFVTGYEGSVFQLS